MERGTVGVTILEGLPSVTHPKQVTTHRSRISSLTVFHSRGISPYLTDVLMFIHTSFLLNRLVCH